MSDTSQGPGWWLASDGKWYPPELWTGPPMTGPAMPQGAPPVDPASAVPAADPALSPSQPNPYATQPSPYPGQPMGYPTQPPSYGAYPYTGPPIKRTNGLAVASLICAIGGFILFIPAVLGVVFGFVAKAQIRQSGGTQTGDGLALAGIIVGFAWIAFLIILIAVDAGNNNNTTGVVGLVSALAAPGLHT